jgi:hypothetical protein
MAHGLAAADERARIGVSTGASINGDRLPCQHGLIDQDQPRIEPDVRWHHCAQRQFYDVAQHDRGSGDRLPNTIAADGGGQGQAGFECVECRLRASLLKIAKRRVHHQKQCNDAGLGVGPRTQLQQNGRFQHPRHGRPQLLQRTPGRVLGDIRDGVGTAALQKARRLRTAQAGRVARQPKQLRRDQRVDGKGPIGGVL